MRVLEKQDMTGKEGLWKRIRKPLENIVLISELICLILSFFFGEIFLRLVWIICIIYFFLSCMRLIDERFEQSMKAYEAETKLIRAKWMINEIKDMVEDKSSRQDVIDFIEQCSKDFEI